MPTDEFTAAGDVRAVPMRGPRAALDAGTLAIHAVAFSWAGRGAVVTGPSGTGKTAVLLAALAAGAELVAAEHAFIDRSGRLTGQREDVRVRPRHRRDLPAPAKREYGRTLAAWAPLDRASAGVGRLPGFPPAVAARVRERVRDRAWVDVPADRFAEAQQPVALDTLVVLARSDPPHKQLELIAMTVEAAGVQLAGLFEAELAADEKANAAAPAISGARTTYAELARDVLRGRRLLHAGVPPGELTRVAAHDLVARVLTRSSR